MKWVSSGGGPLLLLEQALLSDWHGVDGGYVDQSDYDRACMVDDLVMPIRSPGLARRPDPAAFAEHFVGAEAGVVVFPNLGGDAVMVVPRPIGELSAYGHLAAFVRHAPEAQRHALWQSVGESMIRRVGARPVWLSTAGAGVSWLQIRLDDRPKYYGFGPYKEIRA